MFKNSLFHASVSEATSAAFAVGEGVGSLPDNGGMPGHNHLADALARVDNKRFV